MERFHNITYAYAMLRAHQAAADLSRLHRSRWRQQVRALSWVGSGAWCLGMGGLIIVGCYALQSIFRHAAPTAPPARLPRGLAQSVSPRAYVTIGSTHDAVHAIH